MDFSVKLPDNATPRQKELAIAIEEERKKKSVIFNDIRGCKRRLAYKMSEKEAAIKNANAGKKSTKNIGYLRRRKEQIEFRIATEAFTLDAEKDLIRKKNAIDAELEEAIKSYRTRRKAEFLENDINELNKKIEESSKALEEIEKKLDTLYGELRQIGGESRKRAPIQKKQHSEPTPIETSLYDMAIIKDKKEEKKNNSE